ncbi:cupin domain-containing protein [Acinetobacter baumannii]|nr:cupin domain-containing protein [Acinetobacter baumannii]MDC5547782.1 cupin domain-containing protein [Acinetobacter baumannii]MDX7929030.1 cupin domain-containing protein [Acinetobacter baumannii]
MLIDFKMSYAEFRDNYQEKKPVVIKNALKKNNITWSDINDILGRCDASSRDFRVSFPDGNVAKDQYIESYSNIGFFKQRIVKPKFYDFLKKGATVVANNIFNEPIFNNYAKEIAKFTGRQTLTSTYIAFGEKDSYREHWDTRDVFAVQVIGRKRWLIYEPSLELPIYMQQSRDFENEFPCPDKPYMDIILEEGDILYMPRGWWHNPSPLGEPTVHLAIGTFPAFAIDYAAWIFKKLPEVYSARVALEKFEDDSDDLHKLANFIHASLVNKENYQEFMEDFFMNQRMESRFNLETLGDENTSKISSQKYVAFNSFRNDLSETSVITALGKINFDSKYIELRNFILNKGKVKVSEIICELKDWDENEVSEILYHLAQNDVLEVSDY